MWVQAICSMHFLAIAMQNLLPPKWAGFEFQRFALWNPWWWADPARNAGTPVEIWREHLCKCAQLRRDDEKKEIEIYGHSKAWLELELFCKSRKPQIIFLYQVHPGLRIAGPFYLSCDLQTPLSWLQGCVGFWWNLLRFTAKSYAWMAWWWRWPIATRAIDIENKANI